MTMNVDHIHFYVEDASFWRDWFIQVFGFESILSQADRHTQTEGVRSGAVDFWLSSALTPESPVAEYLQRHPAGVVDVAFQMENLAMAIAQALDANAKTFQHTERSAAHPAASCQILGWGNLRHTLIETYSLEPADSAIVQNFDRSAITGIDHIVLNVAKGELEPAIAFYEQVFGFQRQQSFAIRTKRSALYSQVLTHPEGNIKLPINEPATASSQIQEFLDLNGGAGIQHLALRTEGIVEAIAQFRQRGLSFLQVPFSYYEQLRQREGFQLTEAEWEAIARQEVLVDWEANHSPL
jgi:4-hydroxyphenylpyruvate dioxygenase